MPGVCQCSSDLSRQPVGLLPRPPPCTHSLLTSQHSPVDTQLASIGTGSEPVSCGRVARPAPGMSRLPISRVRSLKDKSPHRPTSRHQRSFAHVLGTTALHSPSSSSSSSTPSFSMAALMAPAAPGSSAKCRIRCGCRLGGKTACCRCYRPCPISLLGPGQR